MNMRRHKRRIFRRWKFEYYNGRLGGVWYVLKRHRPGAYGGGHILGGHTCQYFDNARKNRAATAATWGQDSGHGTGI